MRKLKDRDFLKTPEGFLFCVVGYSHPRGRVISYLKYVPGSKGKWGRGNERYIRTMPNYTMPSLLKNIEMLSQQYPQYVFYSNIFQVKMSAVPSNCVVKHYFPELKLLALFKVHVLDPLQEATIELASILARELGISKNDFGVTGSILTDIHNPRFSDIDLVVYGGSNAWKLKKFLQGEVTSFPLRKPPGRSKILKRWVERYPLTLNEAESIYNRRWNYGYFKERFFSVHAVRKDQEIGDKYYDKTFFPKGIVEGEAEIIAADYDSLFLPCRYQIKGLEVKSETGVETVDEVVSYDGFYAGLFECGDFISVKGKLELVKNKKDRHFLRVLIGSPEAEGRDYIKLRKRV